jgi:hypothetical protein
MRSDLNITADSGISSKKGVYFSYIPACMNCCGYQPSRVRRHMSRLITRAAASAVFAAVCVVASQAASSETLDTPKPADPGLEIVYQEGAGTVSVPLTTSDTKEQWLAKYGPPKFSGPSSTSVVSHASQVLTGEGYASGPAGNQSFRAYGATFYSLSCFWRCDATFSNNYADISWLGNYPSYNAQTIVGSMKWWLSGLNITFSVPPGVGFQQSGSGVLWQPPGVNDTWREILEYEAGVKITADYVHMVYFDAQGDILLGNHWYHVGLP